MNPFIDKYPPSKPHRKWAPSDELTWEKRIIVPLAGKESIVKYPGSPIISVGASGNYDGDGLGTPSVIIVDGMVFVYYYGDNQTYADYRRFTINMATANLKDIESTAYSKNALNPILSADSTGWENATGSLGLYSPAVLYDPEATNAGTDTKFKMWYVGSSGATGYSAVGYAYSTDGYNWTKYSGNPVVTNTFGDSLNRYPAIDVIRIGDLLYLLYRNAAGNLSLAYSEDMGLTFTNLGECLVKGATGAWDDNTLGFGHLYHASGVLYLGYAGQNSTDSQQRGGLATISLSDLASGAYTFSKFFRNPVMSENNPNSSTVDDKHNYGTGAIIQYDDSFYFFTDIQGTASPRQIGLAYIKR